MLIADPDAMHRLGVALAGTLDAGDLVVLSGPLGAGKTTLTRGLGEGLQVRGTVTSPTFVLARTHPSTTGRPPLVHVDAYRLGSAAELDDLDIDYARSIVVVEWGRGMLDGLTENWLDIEIIRPVGAAAGDSARRGTLGADADLDLDEPRTVTITANGPRWAGDPRLRRLLAEAGDDGLRNDDGIG